MILSGKNLKYTRVNYIILARFEQSFSQWVKSYYLEICFIKFGGYCEGRKESGVGI